MRVTRLPDSLLSIIPVGSQLRPAPASPAGRVHCSYSFQPSFLTSCGVGIASIRVPISQFSLERRRNSFLDGADGLDLDEDSHRQCCDLDRAARGLVLSKVTRVDGVDEREVLLRSQRLAGT